MKRLLTLALIICISAIYTGCRTIGKKNQKQEKRVSAIVAGTTQLAQMYNPSSTSIHPKVFVKKNDTSNINHKRLRTDVFKSQPSEPADRQGKDFLQDNGELRKQRDRGHLHQNHQHQQDSHAQDFRHKTKTQTCGFAKVCSANHRY